MSTSKVLNVNFASKLRLNITNSYSPEECHRDRTCHGPESNPSGTRQPFSNYPSLILCMHDWQIRVISKYFLGLVLRKHNQNSFVTPISRIPLVSTSSLAAPHFKQDLVDFSIGPSPDLP